MTEETKEDTTTVNSPDELMNLLGGRATAAQDASMLFSHNIKEFTGKGLNEPCNPWDVIQIFYKLEGLKNARPSK